MKSIDENEVVTKGLSGEKHILNKHLNDDKEGYYKEKSESKKMK